MVESADLTKHLTPESRFLLEHASIFKQRMLLFKQNIKFINESSKERER